MTAKIDPDALESSPLLQTRKSLSRAISKEDILLLAGATAVLLQLTEPGVGAGVKEHSNFAHRVMDRLRTTMAFMYAVTFGTAEEKKTVVDMIARVHARVSGALGEGALDPAPQLWVAATLYATGISAYERFCGAIADEAEHDGIYFGYSILACSLQAPADMWPPSRRVFWAYFDRQVAALEVTQHACGVGAEILRLRCAPEDVQEGMILSLSVFALALVV
ncbi:hypothetical protein ANO14919_117240 [Xylariales sp. No.14919]|nr:hypothetical protein ANO14919_117240 [Xylariales sp. No.14919]